MQMLILLLALCLFIHDQFPEVLNPVGSWWVLAMLVALPKLAVFCLYWIVCARTRRKLGDPGGAKALRRLDRASAVARVLTMLLYLSDLHLGLLIYLRLGLSLATGLQWVALVDELLVMLPTLALFGALWWAHYPIERRLREAKLIRDLDMGLGAYPIPTRWQYVLGQYRHQVALILVPLWCVLAWSEVVEHAGPGGMDWFSEAALPWAMIGGCGVIFVFAPLIIRLIWDTAPLPDGPLRERLLEMCKTHRVPVNELLLWRTHGGMINAAVMGLIGPLRFILITDALLQQMPQRHVEAVMAHELAHVKKKHMVWLLVSAVAIIGVVEVLAVVALAGRGIGIELVDTAALPAVADVTMDAAVPWYDSDTVFVLGVIACGATLWALCFGWVSRRMERQADSFAVAHMTKERGGETVEPGDAQAMIDALQHVADLNHIRVNRHSWRHGSIAWRQGYLRELVGRPVKQIPVDRQMRWVNLACVLALVTTFALHAWLG